MSMNINMNFNIKKKTKKKQIGGEICDFHEEVSEAKESFLTIKMLEDEINNMSFLKNEDIFFKKSLTKYMLNFCNLKTDNNSEKKEKINIFINICKCIDFNDMITILYNLLNPNMKSDKYNKYDEIQVKKKNIEYITEFLNMINKAIVKLNFYSSTKCKNSRIKKKLEKFYKDILNINKSIIPDKEKLKAAKQYGEVDSNSALNNVQFRLSMGEGTTIQQEIKDDISKIKNAIESSGKSLNIQAEMEKLNMITKKDIEKALLKDKKVAKKIDTKYSQSVETDDKTFEKRMEDEDQKLTFLYFIGALLGVAFIGKSGVLDSPPGLGSGFG
jgi:hypothetical protein